MKKALALTLVAAFSVAMTATSWAQEGTQPSLSDQASVVTNQAEIAPPQPVADNVATPAPATSDCAGCTGAAPMTMTAAPCACGMTTASNCGCAAPAPCCATAPQACNTCNTCNNTCNTCCEPQRARRVGVVTRLQNRRNCDTCCDTCVAQVAYNEPVVSAPIVQSAPVAASPAPVMTTVSAPAETGCCGSVAPVETGCCGNTAPVVANACNTCCDPCATRRGFRGRIFRRYR